MPPPRERARAGLLAVIHGTGMAVGPGLDHRGNRLLTVLTRLTALEPAQAALLARIIAGPLLSADDLHAAGTRWPAMPKDRHPHYSYDSLRPAESPDGQGTLGI